MSHREHAVGDDAGEPHRAGDLVVLMQRVLIPAGICVRAYILARHDACERWELITDLDLVEVDAHAGRSRSIMVARATATT